MYGTPRIKDKIYKNGDKCVTFSTMYSKCSIDAKVLSFENENN
jgi:hypothetical protein